MYVRDLSGANTITLYRCGKKVYGQMSNPSPYYQQVGEFMCAIHQEDGTSLNA